MEELGKTYIVVIEPSNFSIKQNKVIYDEFGFVISSQSEVFRDLMSQLVKKCHSVRVKYFGPRILTDIRKNIKGLGRKDVKTEMDTLKLVATFFDIAYYTAVSNNKNAHFRTFSAFIGSELHYFFYVGSIDYKGIEIIEKIERIKNKNSLGSYFELLAIKI